MVGPASWNKNGSGQVRFKLARDSGIGGPRDVLFRLQYAILSRYGTTGLRAYTV